MYSGWLDDLIRDVQLLGASPKPFDSSLAATLQALERLSPPPHPFEEAIGRHLLIRLLARLGRFSNDRLVCLKSGWAERLITADDWQSFKQECVQSISAESNAEATRDNILVRRATDVIRMNIRDVTVITLARELRCHRRTLERAFRRVQDQSVHHFVVQLRAKAAIELLTTTNLTSESVARNVGFRSRTTLHVVLKQMTGRTPRELRTGSASGKVTMHH